MQLLQRNIAIIILQARPDQSIQVFVKFLLYLSYLHRKKNL